MRWNAWALAGLALAAGSFDDANAEAVSAHFESSGTEQRLRSNAGLSIERDRVRLRADVALRSAASAGDAAQRRPSGSTEVVPNLRSAFTIAKNLDIETRVNFAEWNSGTDATVDTRLRYRRSLDSFFDELDGSVSRAPDGSTKQTLRLGFNEVLGDLGEAMPLTIAGEAIFEAAQDAAPLLPTAANDSRRVRVETRVAGLLSSFVAADHTLSFGVEKAAGPRVERASMFGYDQSWTLRSLMKLGFNLKLQRRADGTADDVEPSIHFNWRSQL
jgi:hypothetical protein